MKNYVSSLGLILISCAKRAHPEEVVLRMFDHFNRHQWNELKSMYTRDARFMDPMLSEPRIGTERMTEFYESVSDIRDSVVTIFSAGNKVSVEFISTGTLPDGKRFSLPICSILTVKGNQITEDHTYYNLTK